jgi:7-cyano-7-deazaguanine synthase in queuosine biosynthesis
MPPFRLRLSTPTSLPTSTQARGTFVWSAEGAQSFVSKVGRKRLGPRLGALGPVPAVNIDFVRLAAIAYAADRSTRRRQGGANWSQRSFVINVPVSDPDRWAAVKNRVEALLAFLSGDEWSVDFSRSRPPREGVVDPPGNRTARVVLLSGGADSAIGALVSRAELRESAQVLVSHFGPSFLPPIQRDVAAQVARLLPGPDQAHHQIHFVRGSSRLDGTRLANDYSTRTRSLLFLSFGLAVASLHGSQLWVPENGFASLNPPLGPDRRGSLSTRTTHPAFLAGVAALLQEIGGHGDLINPFAHLTKGEMFQKAASLVGREQASKFLSSTHSCAHTGHRTFGASVSAQCGVCFGCSVRRAAFAAGGLKDSTHYLSAAASTPQMHRYLDGKSIEVSARAFLSKGVDTTDIAAMSLPDDYATVDALELCRREIKELRQIFP